MKIELAGSGMGKRLLLLLFLCGAVGLITGLLIGLLVCYFHKRLSSPSATSLPGHTIILNR